MAGSLPCAPVRHRTRALTCRPVRQVLPSIIYIGSGGENIQPQGVNIAPALISISPVHDQIGAAGLNASPVGISVGVAAAAPDEAQGAGGTTSTTPQTMPSGGK